MKMDFKLESRQLIWDYLLLTVGALLTAFAFAAFFVTNDIAPGGVTGIATVLSSVTGLNVGLLSFLINVPLFAIGWRRVGVRFAVRSFISMLLLSLFIDLMPEFDLAGNMMLAAIFGGVTMGAGLGMVVRAGATTGGTDMAAMIVHAHLSMFTVPMVLFTIDGIVVVVAALNFGVQAGLFALIALFVSTKTMDSVIKGFNTAMQFLIISPNQEEIVRRIHTEMDRGCTRLEATGTYEGRKNGAAVRRPPDGGLPPEKDRFRVRRACVRHGLRRARGAGRGIQLSPHFLTACTKMRAMCESPFTKQGG